MSEKISLKKIEQGIFKQALNDGLWDIFLGCFFLIFVIAPFLSVHLGDFWSSFVFIPFWALVFCVLWIVRKQVVAPRIGNVKYGQARKTKLMRFSIIMLAINILAFIGGLFAALNADKFPGQMYSYIIGLLLLSSFSLAGIFLGFNRLFLYGLLVGLAPLVGEWLWSKGMVTHHGFPLTFGVVSATMIIFGLFLLIRLIRQNPVPPSDIPFQEA